MSGNNRASFKSYLTEVNSEAKKRKKLVAAYEKMYQRPDEEVEKLLHSGEIITGHASKVIKYCPHDDPARGISGSLVCTNFRVLFVAADQPTYDLNELNNHLLGKHDIPLSNIDTLYVEYPNKRKRLLPSSKLKDGIQRLEIHCKDFRIAAFNFKLTVKFEEQGVVKAILHHSYPSTVSLLFAFDYRHDVDSQRAYERSGVPAFRSYADWQALLRKYDADESWRVTSVNQSFDFSATMAGYFIVPKAMTDKELKTAVNQFNNSRVPMWCWSAANGCALVRSSELRSDTELMDVEKEIFEKIENNGSNRTIKAIDISKLCQSHSQIQQNFSKLKNLCLITSLDDFYSVDSSWLTALQATKWMQSVAACLAVATDALHQIVVNQVHVVIKESSGVDVTPVITSLIQLMADPSCRTITGFQSLIQREWVVAGFPFLDRLGHLHQPTKSKANALLTTDSDNVTTLSPVFLLFLDCVWQLLRQYPSSFEFTSIYLTALYDSSRFDVFDTFLFNNERERDRAINSPERVSNGNMLEPPPVWDWSLQFNDKSRKLFINPLYRFTRAHFNIPPSPAHSLPSAYSLSLDSLDLLDPPSPSTDELPPSPNNDVSDDVSGVQLHYNSKTGILSTGLESGEEKKKRNRFSISRRLVKGKSHTPDSPESPTSVTPSDIPAVPELQDSANHDKGDLLYPRTSLVSLDLWSSCYFRWLPWSQVFGGAPAVTHLRHSCLYDEVYQLNKKILQLERQLDDVTEKRHSDVIDDDSGMYFIRRSSVAEPSSLESTPEALITNFFPFVPVKCDNSKTVIGSAFPNYHRTSSILSSRNRAKHARSSSDISVPTSLGDDHLLSSQSLNSPGDERRRSSSAQAPKPPEQSAKPKKKVPLMPPSKPLTPPRERITYISSV